MQSTNFVINNRNLACSSNLENEFNFAPNKNYIFNLSYLSSLDVIGDKSADFLQGQVSADVLAVNQTKMQPSAICNLQGRIIALLNVTYWNQFHLILPDDLVSSVQKVLKKTAMFSRVTVTKNPDLSVYGFYLQNSEDKVPFNANLPKSQYDTQTEQLYCCYKIAPQLYIFIVYNTAKDMLQNDFTKEQQRSELAWHSLYLKSGHVDIYPCSSALFLPHRLGLEKTSYINFKKGCYLGQEIIARTHYRAKLKHEMRIFTSSLTDKPYSGQKILDSKTNSEIGEIIDFSPISNNHYIIAISSFFNHSNIVIFEGHEESSKLDLFEQGINYANMD
jgi:tRNA-modifying protein YgfZ